MLGLNGASVNGKLANSSDLEREEAIRAESMAIIDDLKERLAQAESQSEQYKRQVEVLQSKLDDALKEQAKLEERLHESEEQIEVLKNEKREAARQIREMENIYEAERSAMMKEKEEMASREEEMQAVIQRLKDSLAQRNSDEDRPSRQSNNNSSGVDSGNFAPPSSIHRSDSRNNSKLLLQKDKVIEQLRLELAETQLKLVEAQNQDGGRLAEVERQLMEARIANARLMEDNESYQLLLQERTMKGDFAPTGFSSYSSSGASANQDALAALEGRRNEGTSLADELNAADVEAEAEAARRLEAELKSVKDQNKALTLYINKIIERLLQSQGFEHILEQDPVGDKEQQQQQQQLNTNKELPPPPPKPLPQQPLQPSLLQRAKTMSIPSPLTNFTTKPKPRPVTTILTSNQSSPTALAISNPETAPSIPIGLARSASARRPRPMSEQFTGAASIVNAMYKPSPEHTSGGPLSPASFRSSGTFFPIPGSRRASGGGFPIAVGGSSSVRSSETSSITSKGDDRESVTTGTGDTPASGSPPRTHREREATTFTGNKPRPLRLVQETNAEKEAQNKRQSWVGWVGSAFGRRNTAEE